MPALITDAARRLTASLAELKDRVRSAVAGETARAVGDAVRRAVALALAGRGVEDGPPDRRPHHSHPAHDPWDESDEGDPWAEPGGWEDDDAPPPRLPADTNGTTRTRLAVAAGLAAGRWWLRRGSAAGAVAVGTLVALAVVCGGSAVQSAARALAAAADLAAAGRALAPPAPD